MAQQHNRIIQMLYLALSVGFLKLTQALPLPLGRCLGTTLAHLAYYGVPRIRKVGLENLDLAYGDRLSSAEKRRILRRATVNTGLVAAELSRLPALAKIRFAGYAKVEGLEHHDPSRGALCIAGHLGNWEWLAPVFATAYPKIAEVVRDFDNPHLNVAINRNRCGGGITTISKNNAAGEIMRLLREGYGVGVLIDQSPRRNAVPVTFFGAPCWATTAPVIAAIRAKVPVHPVSAFRDESGGYTMRFYPPLELVRTGDLRKDLVENTQRCQNALEQLVRQHPEQWLWFHRRWKERPKLEEEWNSKSRRTTGGYSKNVG